MTKDEVEMRLRKELNLPFYNAKITQREYTELEFQALKTQLQKEYLDYVDEYIDYAENDV